jgi:hypothetical protein|tara:strand:- start:1650 stop:1778 length:129 start_codon:yes stop_codon:yes gene_type:complete
MKTMLSTVGAVTIVLWVLGVIGIGNFVFIYGPEKITCIKESK